MNNGAKTVHSLGVSRRKVLVGLGLAAGSSVLSHAAAPADETPRKTKGNSVLGECGIHHAGILTREWDRTMTFHQKGLGFVLKTSWGEAPNRAAYLDAGDGTCIEVSEDLSFVSPPPATKERSPRYPVNHFCLRATRIDPAIEKVRGLGAKVIDDSGEFVWHTTTPTGVDDRRVRAVFLEGPSGEWVELLENAP